MSFLTVFAFLRFDHGAWPLIANYRGRLVGAWCQQCLVEDLGPNNWKMVMGEYPRLDLCMGFFIIKSLNVKLN